MESIMKENTIRILEAFAYITKRASKKNMYIVLKVFYLADKLHMERFGRFIFNDQYAALAKGPVPSLAYDLIKIIRRNQELPFSIKAPVKVLSDHQMIPLRGANEDVFSRSDIECLDHIIELSKNKDLGALTQQLAAVS